MVMTVSGKRPEYLAQTLESWDWAVKQREPRSLTAFLEPGANRFECANLLAHHGWEVKGNSEVLQVLTNTYKALDWGSKQPGFTVLAEEDVLVSSDTVSFYELGAGVADAGGYAGVVTYSPWRQKGQAVDGMYLTSTYFCPLGWGCWPSFWERSVRPDWFDVFRGPAPRVAEGWDFGMTRQIRRHGWKFVHPLESRGNHIGEFGENMRPESFPASQAASFVRLRKPPLYEYLESLPELEVWPQYG